MKMSKEAWLQKIVGSGLTLIDVPAPRDIPTVLDAWSVVAHIWAEPVEKIGQADPDALVEVDRQWFRHALRMSVFADDGSFLITVAGPGISEFGWARVRWVDGVELASSLTNHGSPEFIAMSIDGRRMCGVTTEEYDYWVMAHEFSDAS
ncbi:hypothetical protein [Streptomyces sp. UNOC14_S4]|uniref:hypothetical protein n=1 Tax=Streptomyces sp. UNOC14_S4 TaxID=2872340 RepID=UPI001E6508D1|nr:hypothetical protein [Streptomyces sp. UNOC14_S4]MCC3768380.1 hypothetical protein [Streptomyces sp. UNOC14_S4]